MSNTSNDNLSDVKYKVLLLGDTTVGKTSLQRFAAGKDFRPNIGSTIGMNKTSPLREGTTSERTFFVQVSIS
jgi:GTPase SAR1 family protein